MMRNRPWFQLYAIWFLFSLLASACSIVFKSGPEPEARKLFEDWAQQAGVPYKDISLVTVANDGAFATVQLTASLKQSATEDWLRKQTNIECRHVGSQWQCNSEFVFSFTKEEQATQDKIAANTATAAMISFEATATELARQAAATQKVLEATQRAFEQSAKATGTAIALEATATALAPRPTSLPALTNLAPLSFLKEQQPGYVDGVTSPIGSGCGGGGGQCLNYYSNNNVDLIFSNTYSISMIVFYVGCNDGESFSGEIWALVNGERTKLATFSSVTCGESVSFSETITDHIMIQMTGGGGSDRQISVQEIECYGR